VRVVLRHREGVMAISKRDALQLAADIKSANVGGHAIAQRCHTHDLASAYAGFVGGLESVLVNFIRLHTGHEGGEAIRAAFNYAPTEADIAERNARVAAYLSPKGAAS
jgi:hypothetical protein